MDQPIFINNHIYHVYNRGVDKRKIFMDNSDYFRFIHDLFEFNDTAPALNIYYKTANFTNPQSYEVSLHKIKNEREPRELIVKILVFCLMPNHIHLLLEQIEDSGITKFMRKLGTGYTNYFNQKYERVGALFQGRFKAKLVDQEPHFIHLPYYIHTNPLDLKFPEWRDKKIGNYKEAIKFLENYKWSSFLDYIGNKNFPSVTQRDFLNEFYNGPQNYRKEFEKWLKEMDLESIDDLIIED